MKKLLKKSTLLMAGFAFASFAHATTHVVTVQNDSFTPSSFTAVVGDTVEWEWVAGGHTTTSLTIPGGAASWNNPMNNSNTTFKYKVTVAGTYNYWCAIHQSMMEASFTVIGTTGIPTVANVSQVIAKVYPNPVIDVLNIHLNITPGNNVLIIHDISGKEVLRETLNSIDNTINVTGWTKGIYFYQLKNGTDKMAGKLEVQ